MRETRRVQRLVPVTIYICDICGKEMSGGGNLIPCSVCPREVCDECRTYLNKLDDMAVEDDDLICAKCVKYFTKYRVRLQKAKTKLDELRGKWRDEAQLHGYD